MGNHATLGSWWATDLEGCYVVTVNLPLPLEEAIKALRLDPTHPLRVKVDDELTVEVRAVDEEPARAKTVGDLLREIGRWEGETGEELDALFTACSPRARQRGHAARRVC